MTVTPIQYAGPSGSSGGSGVTPYVTSIGDGTTLVYTVTHGLATTDVAVTVIDLTAKAIVYPTVGIPTSGTVTVTFTVAPTTNQMRVLVGGY